MSAPGSLLFPLESIRPADHTLLDWLLARVSRLMVEEIAANDRGEQVEEHLAGIQEQLGSNPPLGLLAWNPREVLELERWGEPDQRYTNRPPTGAYGHTKRLLACAILLRNVGRVRVASRHSDEEIFVDTSASTVIQLVRSALAIGGEVPDLAAQLLRWVCEAQDHPSFRPFAALGFLLLAAAGNRLADGSRAALCAWVLAVEAQCRQLTGWKVTSDRWLIGLNCYEDARGRREKWADAASSILTHDAERDLLKRLTTREG